MGRAVWRCEPRFLEPGDLIGFNGTGRGGGVIVFAAGVSKKRYSCHAGLAGLSNSQHVCSETFRLPWHLKVALLKGALLVRVHKRQEPIPNEKTHTTHTPFTHHAPPQNPTHTCLLCIRGDDRPKNTPPTPQSTMILRPQGWSAARRCSVATRTPSLTP